MDRSEQVNHHESIALDAAPKRESTSDRQLTRQQNRMLERDSSIRHQDTEKLEGVEQTLASRKARK